MRRYDEPIDVRQGIVSGVEAPEQFLWRSKLWVVREIVGHWIETGAWWEQSSVADLLGEQEVWRVAAGRGRVARANRRLRGRSGNVSGSVGSAEPAGSDGSDGLGYGVFDLVFDWGGGRWRLVCSLD